MIEMDEIKNLNKTEMKILMKNGKIKIKKLWNDLDEYEMNELEEEIKILKEKGNKLRRTIEVIKYLHLQETITVERELDIV